MSPQLASTSSWTKYSPTLSTLCVTVLDHYDPEASFGGNIHRSKMKQPKSRERAVLAETAKDSVTGVVAIPSVIFFPDIIDPIHILYY